MEPEMRRELEAVPDEPLLPVEKKLIVGSLVLGIVLLALLAWISSAFFAAPATPTPPETKHTAAGVPAVLLERGVRT